MTRWFSCGWSTARDGDAIGEQRFGRPAVGSGLGGRPEQIRRVGRTVDADDRQGGRFADRDPPWNAVALDQVGGPDDDRATGAYAGACRPGSRPR